jgi:hypothetical protein
MSRETNWKELTLEQLWQVADHETAITIAANNAYTQWSQLRVAAMKLAGRFNQEGKEDDEAWEPLLKIIEIGTRKVEAIEAFMVDQRRKTEVLSALIEQKNDSGR